MALTQRGLNATLAGCLIEDCTMAARVTFPGITHDPNVMGGKACVRGLRVTVGMVLGLLAAGRTPAEIVEAYPVLGAR